MHCLKLRVAAVQMTSVNRAVEANLRRAEALAEKATKQGAQLALLPELFAAGFELNEHAWETAEPQGGDIERWLCGTARRQALADFLGESRFLVDTRFLRTAKIAAGNNPEELSARDDRDVAVAAVLHLEQGVHRRFVGPDRVRILGHHVGKACRCGIASLREHPAHSVAAGKDSDKTAIVINDENGADAPFSHVPARLLNRCTG